MPSPKNTILPLLATSYGPVVFLVICDFFGWCVKEIYLEPGGQRRCTRIPVWPGANGNQGTMGGKEQEKALARVPSSNPTAGRSMMRFLILSLAVSVFYQTEWARVPIPLVAFHSPMHCQQSSLRSQAATVLDGSWCRPMPPYIPDDICLLSKVPDLPSFVRISDIHCARAVSLESSPVFSCDLFKWFIVFGSIQVWIPHSNHMAPYTAQWSRLRAAFSLQFLRCKRKPRRLKRSLLMFEKW